MKMDALEVKSYLNKFPLKLLNTLAASYKLDALLSTDDVYAHKTDLERKKEILADLIAERNDSKTYKKIKEIASSIEKVECTIEEVKQELKPLEREYREKRTEFKQIQAEKAALIELKIQEFQQDLPQEDVEKVERHDEEIEQARVKLLREKQMLRGLKAYAQGLVAAVVEGTEENYVSARRNLEENSLKLIQKTCEKIKKDNKIDLDTELGLEIINTTLDERFDFAITNALNNSRYYLKVA